MQSKSLYIKRMVDGEEHNFPSDAKPVRLGQYTYTAQRMGGTPSLSGSFMYEHPLDDEWSGEEYVEFNGERYTIQNTPSSSKSNSDLLYKHDITFVSERIKLENEFFYDVVTDDTEEQYQDRFRSNMSEFSFMGDINEFVARLNDSLVYTNLYNKTTGKGYRVVIDEGITSETKEVSFSDKYFAEALQEINTTYKLAYYFKGKEIHVGYTENVIPNIIEYGKDKGLLSIQKQNANNKIVDRITGVGSSDNIPYYYPNESADGQIPYASSLMPSVYRDSFGAERYYNAINDGYSRTFADKEGMSHTIDYSDRYLMPDTSIHYQFGHTYSKDNPHAAKQAFEDIRPSIKGMRNAEGKLFGEIADIAFDDNDSDELIENGSENSMDYKHSYFYIRLNVYDGEMGFNIFDQALESDVAKISMTSGACAACNFEIGVIKSNAEDRLSYIFKNPVQVDSQGMIVGGDYDRKVSTSNFQPIQQDTSTASVWIAVKKEIDTFGVIMPNATHGYRPKKGDKFVITGIKMPQQYILHAEKELDKALIQYMKENNDDKFNFSVTFSRIWLEHMPDVAAMINENARLTIRYNNKDVLLYVTDYTVKVDDKCLVEITVSLAEEVAVAQSSLTLKLNEMKEDILSTMDNADVLAIAARHFLRKDISDEARELITFLKGLNIGRFNTGPLGAGGFFGIDSNGDSYLEADRLFIRKVATFVELVISKLSHIGGQLILSPARLTISRIEEYDGYWRCFFNTTDGERVIHNEFADDDMARCQTFDAGQSTHYWWRKVITAGEDYIDISKTDCDPDSDRPRIGDEVVQLGNSTDTTRQSAQILSTVGDDAPSWKMYKGIDSFSLADKAKTFFSSKGNKIEGEFVSTSTGESIDDILRRQKMNIEYLQDQSDKEYTIWFGDAAPTMESEPTTTWFDEDGNNLYEEHVEDIYYISRGEIGDNGRAYRFTQTNDGTEEEPEYSYSWELITDADTLAALEGLRATNAQFQVLQESIQSLVTAMEGGEIVTRSNISQYADEINMMVESKQSKSGLIVKADGIQAVAGKFDFVTEITTTTEDGQTVTFRQPYIRVAVDAQQMPHLVFYAPDGQEAYDLGWTGLHSLIINAIAATMTQLGEGLVTTTTSRTYTASDFISAYTDGFATRTDGDHALGQAYMFRAARTQGSYEQELITADGAQYDGKYFATNEIDEQNNKPTDTTAATEGLYYRGHSNWGISLAEENEEEMTFYFTELYNNRLCNIASHEQDVVVYRSTSDATPGIYDYYFKDSNGLRRLPTATIQLSFNHTNQ